MSIKIKNVKIVNFKMDNLCAFLKFSLPPLFSHLCRFLPLAASVPISYQERLAVVLFLVFYFSPYISLPTLILLHLCIDLPHPFGFLIQIQSLMKINPHSLFCFDLRLPLLVPYDVTYMIFCMPNHLFDIIVPQLQPSPLKISFVLNLIVNFISSGLDLSHIDAKFKFQFAL